MAGFLAHGGAYENDNRKANYLDPKGIGPFERQLYPSPIFSLRQKAVVSHYLFVLHVM